MPKPTRTPSWLTLALAACAGAPSPTAPPLPGPSGLQQVVIEVLGLE